MQKNQLFNYLVGLPDDYRSFKGFPPLKPQEENYFFLAKGYVMEYLLIVDMNISDPPAEKIISLFWGPEEFVIPSHPKCFHLIALGKAKRESFTYSAVFGALRKFPQSKVYYKELKQRYQEKVEDRIRSLETMTGEQRFHHLKATMPGIFAVAKKEDIAAYLRIPIGMLRKLEGKR